MPGLQSGESKWDNQAWYDTERNTADLVKAVLEAVPARERRERLSGEDIWALLKLTWISKGKKNGETTIHYKKLRETALETLFGDMNPTSKIMSAAEKRTGHVNAYRAYRNSLEDWCKQNAVLLRSIREDAKSLRSDDKDRLDLASRIANLRPVPTPKHKKTKPASDFLTPLVAAIDPESRFPMINGARHVEKRLADLGLTSRSLREQVEGLIRCMDELGLDAQGLDTMPQRPKRRSHG